MEGRRSPAKTRLVGRTGNRARLRFDRVGPQPEFVIAQLSREVGIVHAPLIFQQLSPPTVVHGGQSAGLSVDFRRPAGVGNHLMDDDVDLGFGEFLSA